MAYYQIDGTPTTTRPYPENKEIVPGDERIVAANYNPTTGDRLMTLWSCEPVGPPDAAPPHIFVSVLYPGGAPDLGPVSETWTAATLDDALSLHSRVAAERGLSAPFTAVLIPETVA